MTEKYITILPGQQGGNLIVHPQTFEEVRTLLEGRGLTFEVFESPKGLNVYMNKNPNHAVVVAAGTENIVAVGVPPEDLHNKLAAIVVAKLGDLDTDVKHIHYKLTEKGTPVSPAKLLSCLDDYARKTALIREMRRLLGVAGSKKDLAQAARDLWLELADNTASNNLVAGKTPHLTMYLHEATVEAINILDDVLGHQEDGHHIPRKRETTS